MKTDNAYALHIAFFLHDLRGGGVERITIHLANEMCRMGCKIDLVLINKIGEQAYFRSIDSSVSIIELPQKRTLTSCVGFRTYIRKHQPNIVVSALTHINVSTLLSVSFLKKKPYIFVVEHNHRIGRQKNGSLEDLGTAIRLAFRLVPDLYPRANTVGVVSDGIRSALAAAIPIPKEQITLLHNPVTAPDSKGLPEACTVLPWLAQSNVPFILGVGSLSYEKSFDLLIEAFARVRRNRPLRLVIAGEGPKRLELEEKAQDCGFPGRHPSPRVREQPICAHERCPTACSDIPMGRFTDRIDRSNDARHISCRDGLSERASGNSPWRLYRLPCATRGCRCLSRCKSRKPWKCHSTPTNS